MFIKTCKNCHNELEDSKFEWTNKLKRHRRSICSTCRSNIKIYRQSFDKNYREKHSAQRIAYGKLYRKQNLERLILSDSRKSDKRKNRQNDLDLEFIKSQISNPCSYCGETKLRMTLDRVDNSLGHLKSNIVPACIRCNYARRDMPHKAWLLLIDGMRQARESGAFDNWTGSIWK